MPTELDLFKIIRPPVGHPCIVMRCRYWCVVGSRIDTDDYTMVRRLLVPIDSLSTDSTDTNRALRQIQFHDGERGKDLQLHGVRTCCRDRVLSMCCSTPIF